MFTTAQTLAVAAAFAGRWEMLSHHVYDLTPEMVVDAAALLIEHGEDAAARLLIELATAADAR
ncbi:hypothetical protein [Actinomadura litoris]|uniref:hypothetical protein n=1 Tax=Actinomadura litoris TaxID=2678616 RepID=UPI001FA6F95B|nr:hypothetical protein [Actinomadura litoris]